MASVPEKITKLSFLALLLPIGLKPSLTPQSQTVNLIPNDFTIVYDFETGLEGWTKSPSSQVRGITKIEWASQQVKSGQHAMKLAIDLDSSVGSKLSGEALVTMSEMNLSDKTISAWIYAPVGARGDPNQPNGVHLFAEDKYGKKLYGTWQNILEGGWFQVALQVTNSKPACGYIDNSGFDPTKVRKIGINISVPTTSPATFNGMIHMDAVAFGTPSAPVSDHLYGFDSPDILSGIPRWNLIPDWGAEGLDPPVVQNSTLSMAAHFNTASEAQRKGALGILYSPVFDLSNKNETTISADIRFDPPATDIDNCPFVLSIGAFDDRKQKWFWSDNIQVGSGDWTSVSFDLGDHTQLKPEELDYEGDTPTLSEIRQVGFQLWANVPYNGQILFDNIAVGGEEKSYDIVNAGIVQSEGGQFTLNGEPFRFVGANAEYLFTEDSQSIGEALDLAMSMHISVMRTWGFSDGCENETIENCELWSQRFQPRRGQWNETAFEQFDRIVGMAGERGIRLIVPLANNWREYGGRPQYVTWLEEEYPEEIPSGVISGTHAYNDLFYTNERVKQWYKDYATKFISRTNSITGIPYNQDPTIFAWELINEPRASSDSTGETLHNWLVEMSQFVNDLDPYHMIGTGEEGWYIMPKAEADEKGQSLDGTMVQIWQNFPGNYWQYGVNWKPENEDPWSSDGVDFISDHNETDTEVCWQAYAGESDQAPVECEIRPGIPDIDFTSMHLYIGAGASNLYLAPYCDAGFDEILCNPTYDRPYHQALLWVTDHISDSLALGKPIIVGEFGFRTSGAGGGSGQQPGHIPPFEAHHRAKLYEWYLNSMFDLGVNGALFWNIGIEGFPESIWDGGDSLEDAVGNLKWQYAADSDATSLDLCSDPNYVTQGRYALCVDYDPGKGHGKTFLDRINILETDADWSEEYRHRLRFDILNETAAFVVVRIVTGDSHTWYESLPQHLTTGKWNSVIVDTTAEIWKSAITDWQYNTRINDLDDVHQVSIGIINYSSRGRFYVDNLRHIGNDGLVIYADDPAIPAIREANCRNWLECSYIHLPLILKSQ